MDTSIPHFSVAETEQYNKKASWERQDIILAYGFREIEFMMVGKARQKEQEVD